jgi:soluble lytic murein transglycosylase-like protein
MIIENLELERQLLIRHLEDATLKRKNIQDRNRRIQYKLFAGLFVGLCCLYPIKHFLQPAQAQSCSMAAYWLREYEDKSCFLTTTIALAGVPVEANESKVIKHKTPYINTDFKHRYKAEIELAAKQTGLDKNFIAAVIKQESGGNPKARSHCGAMGLMQLMPATAKAMGCKDPWNPKENILAGSKYLAIQLKKFKSKELALAAYNAGPGNVHRYKRIKETREYVPSVLEYERQIAML